MLVADDIMFVVGAGDGFVLGAIDDLVGAGDVLLDPVVGDDAGVRRAHAGEDRRMAGARLGRGMALIARREDDPGQQACEAFGEMATISFGGVLSAVLVAPGAGADVGMRGAGLGSGRKPGAGAVWAIAGAAAVANRAAAISAFIEGTRVTKPPPL
ncbi:hypothetical protein WR25_23282 [Diploscapter pachys]|uniref:Uncharacterized protein n=1 Tax=Diploscapter pachys TaxID=2018661 RepID=A0A2A2M331_9BILA|nr:hypothetical protein WR25_23282 [Diploscapter pachys]